MPNTITSPRLVLQVNMMAFKSRTHGDFKKIAVFRWLFLFVIAVMTALVAVVITYLTRQATKWKFSSVRHLIGEKESCLLHPSAVTLLTSRCRLPR